MKEKVANMGPHAEDSRTRTDWWNVALIMLRRGAMFRKLMKPMCLVLVSVVTSMLWGDIKGWESLMCERRPHLPAKETRSIPTLKAAVLVKNGNCPDSPAAIRAAAKRVLGAALPDSAVFENIFGTDEERIDVADFMSDGVHNRIAVYGQLGNFVPYYRTADGLPVDGFSNIADFLSRNCNVSRASSVFAVDGVLVAEEVEIKAHGEVLTVPYERFYFVFADDMPGANWAHPCRYVFISEDCTSFTILYKLWRPRLSVKATNERIDLQPVGAKSETNAKSLEKAKEAVYSYAKGLAERNSLNYSQGDKTKSYFVLISGGDDPESNGIRFWSDTAMLYSTLTRKYGVAKDHIKVYVSDGNSTSADANLASTDGTTTPVLVDSPKDLDGDGVGDITGAATKSNVRACFSNLKSSLTSDDQLFVFITSHGGPDGTEGPSNYDSYAMLYDGSGDGLERIDDDELASYTSGFSCPVAFAIETCYAGGFIDDVCATAKRVIATACNHYESSFGWSSGGAWTSGTVGKTGACNSWAAPFTAAFRGSYSMTWTNDGGYPWTDYIDRDVYADSNSDGLVSFREAYLYADENDPNKCTSSSHPDWCSFYYDTYGNYVNKDEHPQYGESTSGLGTSFFMLKQLARQDTYSVTLYKNDGAGLTIKSDLAPAGSWKIPTIASLSWPRFGYRFLGWNTSSTATSALYPDGATITISGPTTLYAIWEAESVFYTVTLNANGGSMSGL